MKGGSTTRVATVLATLKEGLPGSLPQSVPILYGNKKEEQPDDAVILAPSDPDTPGIAITYGATPNRQPVEQIEIAIVIRSYSGDPDMVPRIARCDEIFAGLQDFIRENPRVDQRWDSIAIGPNALWHPVYTDRGCNCYVGLSLITQGLL